MKIKNVKRNALEKYKLGGIILTIDKYIIKKQGAGFNISDTTKESQSVNSHCYLVHAISTLAHDRSHRVKVVAQELLNALESELRGNTESKGNDYEYMLRYREIENDFYSRQMS